MQDRFIDIKLEDLEKRDEKYPIAPCDGYMYIKAENKIEISLLDCPERKELNENWNDRQYPRTLFPVSKGNAVIIDADKILEGGFIKRK